MGQSNAPFGGSPASDIFSGGVVPLDESDHRDGLSLAERGFAEELRQAEAKQRTRKATKARILPEEKKKRGRPKIDRTMTIEDTPAASGMRVNMELGFLREICEMESHLFKLIEGLSSGNFKLTSPASGGIDLEKGYALQERMKREGLL